MRTSECTEACYATPECAVCHRTKSLRGRSYPLAMGGGRCDWDCPGYTQDPQAGHLWQGERPCPKCGEARGYGPTCAVCEQEEP